MTHNEALADDSMRDRREIEASPSIRSLSGALYIGNTLINNQFSRPGAVIFGHVGGGI
jgi:hypothetical protein